MGLAKSCYFGSKSCCSLKYLSWLTELLNHLIITVSFLVSKCYLWLKRHHIQSVLFMIETRVCPVPEFRENGKHQHTFYNNRMTLYSSKWQRSMRLLNVCQSAQQIWLLAYTGCKQTLLSKLSYLMSPRCQSCLSVHETLTPDPTNNIHKQLKLESVYFWTSQ